MAIQQTKKQSDLEKRLRLLRQQVYGKTEMKKPLRNEKLDREMVGPRFALPQLTTQIPNPASNSEIFQSDISYLYSDLRKILVLSCLAIGVQVIIFALTKNHILNLNLF